MTKSFAFAWAVVATFTLYINAASGQGKPEEKKAAAPAAAAPPKAAAPAATAAPAKGEAAPATPPAGPPKPGAETKALQFFIGSWNGTGKMEAGAMGPDSKETTSKTKQTCKWSLGNFWVVCDISDTAGTGKQAMTWMGHMIIGYDIEAKAYRAVGADSMGAAFELNAKMDGNKFVMESARETTMMGMPVKYRFTFDLTDPKAPKFTDERSMKGGPWQLAETTVFKKGG